MNIKMLMGLEANVKNVANIPGQLLFTTDTGKIFFDTENGRVPLYKEVIDNVTTLQELVGTESVATQITKAIQALVEGENPGEDITLVTDVTAGDGISVDNTNPSQPKVSVKVATDNNALKVDANGALRVDATELTDYTVTVTPSTETAGLKKYTITQAATGLNVDIDIPSDMLIKDAAVVTDPEGQPEGTYLALTFTTNGEDKVLYIDASRIVKAASASNAEGAQVLIAVSADSKISATLAQSVKDSLSLANSAVQPSELAHDAETKKYIAGVTVDASGNITYVTGDLPEGGGAMIWETF